jgi:hypothetical protein
MREETANIRTSGCVPGVWMLFKQRNKVQADDHGYGQLLEAIVPQRKLGLDQSASGRGVHSGRSPAMLCPHGADLLRCGDFAALNLGFCLGKISFLFWGQFERRLVDTCESEHNSR